MKTSNITELNEWVRKESSFITPLKAEIQKIIVGQEYLIDRLLIGLLADGHVLLEGVPGLAKTLCIKTLSECIHTQFQRIQFTPDLLPADILGTLIYNPKTGEFNIKKGPVFTNLILADEINRAPSKVQSALLEVMQERQVTIGNETFKLSDPFLVLATQNPIEQEGTYNLPEAQVDRFMLKVELGYPNKKEEKEILNRMSKIGFKPKAAPVTDPEQILKAREVINEMYIDDKVEDYILDLVFATREPSAYKLDLEGLIQMGASPRATIFLTLAAKAYAFLQGRGYVTPQDVKMIGLDVLRHRVMISYEAEAQEMTSETIVRKIFDEIKVP
jgi:MoxR-like ATPase